jgi:hypothetical protein
VKIVTGGINCEIKWIMILIKTEILNENMPATEERIFFLGGGLQSAKKRGSWPSENPKTS